VGLVAATTVLAMMSFWCVRVRGFPPSDERRKAASGLPAAPGRLSVKNLVAMIDTANNTQM
jgi:hypothetical protein